MSILTVGTAPGDYATLAAAVAAAANGDTVALPAGVYTNQTATVTSDITIEGVGGVAYLNATVPVSNAQGLLVVNAPGTVTIQGVAFSGAATSNANGANAAGIRYYSGNLVLNQDAFSGNQNGILATPLSVGTGSISIANSTVTNNGVSDPSLTAGYGYTHNLYIGDVAQFTLTGSAVTAANVGHEVKSRAVATTVANSTIADGPTGTASYSIDTPNGGVVGITGSTIQQGPQSQNDIIISNGEEGVTHPGALAVTGNTIVNNDANPGSVAVVNDGAAANVTGNLVAGLPAGQIDHNAADTVSGNTISTTAPSVGVQVGVDGVTLASGAAVANTALVSTAGPGFSALSAAGTPGMTLAISATGVTGHIARFVLSQAGFTGTQATASFFDASTGLAGAVVTWSVYADAGDTGFATTTLLGSRSFVDPGGGLLVSGAQGFTLPFTPSGAYALTEVVTIAGGAPVPEPMSFVLLAAAVAGVAMARRRRRYPPSS